DAPVSATSQPNSGARRANPAMATATPNTSSTTARSMASIRFMKNTSDYRCETSAPDSAGSRRESMPGLLLHCNTNGGRSAAGADPCMISTRPESGGAMSSDTQKILSQHYLFTSFEPAQLAELAGHVRPLRL